MGGGLDFLKGQIPTNFPSKPGRGVLGLNIDRCITTMSIQMGGNDPSF